MDEFKLLILIVVMSAGFLLVSVGLFLLIRPRASSGEAVIEGLGIKFQSRSEGLVLVFVGAFLLAVPLFVERLVPNQAEPKLNMQANAIAGKAPSDQPVSSIHPSKNPDSEDAGDKGETEVHGTPVIKDIKAVPDQYISGRIEGLSGNQYDDYKVLIYRLTDQWYIHPFASGGEGRSFSRIKSDGRWELKLVWRGNQASMVAVVLTKISTNNLPEIPTSPSDPVNDLIGRTQAVAHYIMEKPERI